jgi:predicted nucleic acid-binding protein
LPLDVPTGAAVFIDANLLHYALIPVPPFTDIVLPFIDRLRAGEFVGYAGFQTLADAQHKTMTSLAAIQYNLTRASIVGWLKNHPDQIQAMLGLPQAAAMLCALPLSILSSDTGLLSEAAVICQTHGLLTNDALIVALMQRHDITHLATNDDDFDRVPGITVWKPRP